MSSGDSVGGKPPDVVERLVITVMWWSQITSMNIFCEKNLTSVRLVI